MEIPDIYNIHRTHLTRKCFSREHPEYYNYIISKYPDIDWKEAIYLDYNHLQRPVCPICGRPVKFISLTAGYHIYCSSMCSGSSEDRIRKIYNTNIKRYGVPHALQNKDILTKQKHTCLERYGDEIYSRTDECKEKVRSTCNMLYGGVGSGSEILKSRMIDSIRKKRLETNSIPNQIGYDDNGDWIIGCDNEKCELYDSCNHTFTISSGNYLDRIRLGYEVCTKHNPVSDGKIKDTYLERFIYNILDESGIEYICNDRSVISPKEVDIYIPAKKLAIECNGIYWHSFKPDDYHIEKYTTCRDEGVQLLTIWQDWIRTRPDIVRSMILSKLGLTNDHIYARRCNIAYISAKDANKFLDDNHIQGRCSSKVHIGLFHDNELVSVMCFSRRSQLSGGRGNNEDEWELIRFCNRLNTNVIGGAGKMLAFFIREYHPSKIVSFSCNDISNGNLYLKLGFVSDYNINKSYWYIDNRTMKRYHRSRFTKSHLREMGYDTEGKTERVIMKRTPYYRIYDSGTTKWIMDIK